MSLLAHIPKVIRSPAGRVYRRLFMPVQGRSRPAHIPDLSAAVPFAYDLSSVTAPSGGIAIVYHMFYVELLAEVRAMMDEFPFAADVFISTDVEEKQRAIQAGFSGWGKGKVDVRISPNRGRDIAPKLRTFADVYPRYDLVLFMHSKKSVRYSDAGDEWRRVLVESLAGSADVVRSIVAIFARRPDIGVVMSQHHELIRDFIHWDGNFEAAKPIAKRMGIELTRNHIVDFPSGSMFWARTAALGPLLDLRLGIADFPDELGQLGGTTQHAIERLFLYACELAGYRWMKVAAPSCFQDRSQIVPVHRAGQIDEIADLSRVDLL